MGPAAPRMASHLPRSLPLAGRIRPHRAPAEHRADRTRERHSVGRKAPPRAAADSSWPRQAVHTRLREGHGRVMMHSLAPAARAVHLDGHRPAQRSPVGRGLPLLSSRAACQVRGAGRRRGVHGPTIGHAARDAVAPRRVHERRSHSLPAAHRAEYAAEPFRSWGSPVWRAAWTARALRPR